MPLRPGEWVDFVAGVVVVAIVGVVGTPPFDCVRSGSDKQIGVVPRFCDHATHTETFSVISFFQFRVKGALGVRCLFVLTSPCDAYRALGVDVALATEAVAGTTI